MNEVKNQSIGSLYGIMADEVTDTSNKEQLGLVLRYTTGNNVVEQLYEYADCKSITGESICREIVSILENLHNFQYQTVELKRTMVLEILLVNKEVARHVFSGLLPKHRIFTVFLMILTLRFQKLAILVTYNACLMLQKLWTFYLSIPLRSKYY